MIRIVGSEKSTLSADLMLWVGTASLTLTKVLFTALTLCGYELSQFEEIDRTSEGELRSGILGEAKTVGDLAGVACNFGSEMSLALHSSGGIQSSLTLKL